MGRRNDPPPTCVRCFGYGTITETKRATGADERGLPIQTEQKTTLICPSCNGRKTA